MSLFRFLIIIGALSFHGLCMATTWSNTVADDPINPELKCDVHEPMSSGSYIYHWPGKYDQVFWPFTDNNGIWFCKKTGFTAFIDDFKNISSEEKDKIAAYLQKNYNGKESIEEKLKLLEGVYALRKTEAEFDNKLLRVLARWYQNLGNTKKANEYRNKALSQIKQRLKSDLPEGQRLEYLYIAANYSMLFGDVDGSKRYTADLLASLAQLKDKELNGFGEYLKELLKETPKIVPGGELDPNNEDDA